MNREQEHNALREELGAFSPALDNVLIAAQARVKKRKRIINCIITPLGSIAAIFLFFVATVNIFPTVAAAMEDVPGLRRLVVAVSFSPSLSEAVEHGFVQDMGLEQEINGVIMRVEHLILDGQQLHIFYTLESETHYELGISLRMVKIEDGTEDGQTSMTFISGTPHLHEDSLRHAIMGFDYELPDVVIWAGEVFGIIPGGDWPGELVGEYSFTLELDSAFIEQAERITLDYDFVLDGQSLTLDTVDINPAHTRVSFAADEDNSAWLRRLEFHMVNEYGERFDPPTPGAGIQRFRTGDNMMMDVHFLETAFFRQSERLYMVIEEVTWLDKDIEYVHINLTEGTSSPLPEGMRLVNVERLETGWIITFSVYERGVYNMHRIVYTRHPREWDGMEFRRIWSSFASPDDLFAWHIFEDTPGLFFNVDNPPVDGVDSTTVSLTPQFSRIVRLDEPVVIRVR